MTDMKGAQLYMDQLDDQHPPPPDHMVASHGSKRPQGPRTWQWLIIAAACIFGGYHLANYLYVPSGHHLDVTVHLDRGQDVSSPLSKPAQSSELVRRDDLVPRNSGGELIVREAQIDLNPFASFVSGNAAAKIGLIVGGVSTFNTGVSNCDQGHYASCVTGIISGLLLTAAGLWAPVPGRRDLQHLPSRGGFSNLTIAYSEFDPSSSHPAHRFIQNYHGVLARNPEFSTGARIGAVSYRHVAPSRHRIVVSPRSNGIGRRQDNEDDDGGSVSYEWNDFGPDNDGYDTNSADYDSIAGGISGYLSDNQANSICLTQCVGTSAVYEVGQLQTQAGTDPAYDNDCEFSDEMVECS